MSSSALCPGSDVYKRQLYELVFMLRGEQIYQAEGRNYCLHSGQFFLTPPDLVHSTGGNFEYKALYYYLSLIHI